MMLEVNHLTKRFPRAEQPAVDDISFALPPGEILALVGPSGCGKTTTLRLIAGLERPDRGAIRLNGREVAGPGSFVPPERRQVGLVFQDHALFPHLTVAQNVAFGLAGRPRGEIRAAVAEMLRLVGLEALAGRHPHALSGGERQRVALARALAPCPLLLLLDEPFSSLDADRRGEMREQVRAILKGRGVTAVFVTHDQEEALYMGDRLAVFQHGQIEQIGGPEEIFHAPATRFVAEFMGDSDFLAGRVAPGGIETSLGLLPQPVDLPPGAAVEVALRGDDVSFDVGEPGNGIIAERFFRGAFNLYRLRLDDGQILHAQAGHTELHPAGARVHARISAGHPLAVFSGEATFTTTPSLATTMPPPAPIPTILASS
jgi:iron(III) transport system ATP-binding protein